MNRRLAWNQRVIVAAGLAAAGLCFACVALGKVADSGDAIGVTSAVVPPTAGARRDAGGVGRAERASRGESTAASLEVAAATESRPWARNRARVRDLVATLDGLQSATLSRRTVEEIAGLVRGLGARMNGGLVDAVLDALVGLKDPDLAWMLAQGIAGAGANEVMGARLLACLGSARERPATEVAVLAALGGAGGEGDVASIRAFTESADAALLPHAVLAAGRIGGEEARAWIEGIPVDGAAPALRHARADALRRFARRP